MKEKEKIEQSLHFIMCFIGGFIGAYALLNRADNFGSAQTANLIEIIFCILGRNLKELLIRLGALGIYIIAMQITLFLTHKTKVNLYRYCILVEVISAVFLAFIPKQMNPVVALYPIFFMMSTQWSIFQGTKGYACSTIFSTNNLKQTVLSLTNYAYKKDVAFLEKGKFFACSILWYHIGVAISYLCYLELEVKASLLCLLPLGIAFYLIHMDAVLQKRYQPKFAMGEK